MCLLHFLLIISILCYQMTKVDATLFNIGELHLLKKMCGTLLVLPKIGGMAKKKIPGQIRFPPELDCISLKGVKHNILGPCEDINFLYTIGQRFFSGWMRGARKSILVWELHKENGAGGGGQVHWWSPLVFLLVRFLYFCFFCIFAFLYFCKIILVWEGTTKMEQMERDRCTGVFFLDQFSIF